MIQITHVETLLLSRMHEPARQWFTSRFRVVKADCPVVVIHTDAGITGIGEACAYGVPRLIDEWVQWYAKELVGKDPTHAATAPHPNGRTWAHDCAAAGIDCALWDIKGQAAGTRVSELLADEPLKQVRLYASGGCRYDWRDHPNQLIEEARDYIAQGYTAMKFRIGTEWSWDGVTVDRFLGLVRELAQTVDGRMELMLDGNQRLTEDQALVIARELDHLGFAWFEEPIPQTDVDGYTRLNAAVDMPITGGEQYGSLEQYRPCLEKRAYGIVQPDAGICGISEALRIAEMAHEYGVDTCPHSWHNGLMCLANAHLVAALPNPRVLELCTIQGPLQWEILAEPPVIERGWLHIPARPGLGAELIEDATTRFPYVEGHYALTVDR